MADGDIKLTVSLTATDIKQTASQLRGEIDKIFKANAGQQLTASMKSVMAQMDKMVNKSAQLESKLREIDQKSLNNITNEWKDVQQKLYSAYDVLEKIDASKDPKGFAKAQQDVERLTRDVQILEREYDRIAQYGSIGLPEYDKTAGQLNEVNNQMVILKARAEDASGASSQITSRFSEVSKAAQVVGNAISSLSESIRGVIRTGISLIGKLASSIKGTLLGAVNTVKKAFDKIKGSIEKAFSANTFKRSLTTLLKYTIGVRSLYFAFRKLRSAVQEGLNNLVQFESETNLTNQRMTEFKTSLLYLKNAWGAAFAPIINVVMPILTAFMDALASVANAIARFIAALTGQSTVIQALKVSVGDYAQSLGGAGSSAKKAADEQKKLNDRLAAFDDLNVLGKDKDDEDTSPSGGGGGGGNLPSVNDMFERINTPLNELAERLRNAWMKGDFFQVGEILGETLKKQLLKIDDWIKNDGRTLILGWGKAIGDIIDGFISVDKLADSIGTTLGDAIALGIDLVNTIVTPTRFEQIGEFLVEGVNAFIPIVLPKLGELFGNLFHSAISLAFGFIKDANWTEWGQAIADAINNFFKEMGHWNPKTGTGLTGWEELGISLSDGAIGLLDMIITAIEGIDTDRIVKALKQVLDKIDWEAIKAKLKELWDALWQTLGELFPDVDFESIKTIVENVAEALTSVGTAIKEYIVDLPWDTVKEIILEISNKLKDVTKEDIKSFIDTVVSVASFILKLGAVVEVANAIAKIVVVGKALKTVLSPLTTIISRLVTYFGGWEAVLGTLNVALGTLSEVLLALGAIKVSFDIGVQGVEDILTYRQAYEDAGGTIWEAFYGGFVSNFEDLKIGLAGIADTFEESGLSGVGDLLWASFTQDEDYLTEWGNHISEVGENVSIALDMWGNDSAEFSTRWRETWDSVKNYWSDVWEQLKTGASETWDSLKEKFNSLKESFTSIGESITSGFNTLKTNISEIWTSIKETVVGIVESIQDTLGDIVGQIVEDWTAGWEALKSGVETAFDGIGEFLVGAINGIIGYINGLLNGIGSGINAMFGMLNNISMDIPDWIPEYGGRSIGFSLPTISMPQIPYLAQGAVIPPNKEFMAVLGDQTSGTNIEAPLDTIRQAVGDELTPYLQQLIEINAQVITAINNKNLTIGDRDIGRANARYTARQNMVRGTSM